MITCKEIKDRISNEDIIKILELLNSNYINDVGDYIISETICHCGNSHKLYYYKENKLFMCYTNCGSMDIFGLIQNCLGLELYEALLWCCKSLGINTLSLEQKNTSILSDWLFIKDYKKSHEINNSLELNNIKVYSDNVFNLFKYQYSNEWISEGISISSMKKYNIMYYVLNHQIIIPHYNINNNLIGIRARNTLEEDVSVCKYIPFKQGGIIYSHALSTNLYGLNYNINGIQKKHKIMLVESEKAVMQCDTMFGKDNFTVALCGSNFSREQLKLLLSLEISEVIIALDKQFQVDNTEESDTWLKHIKEIGNKLLPYFKVTYLWDDNNLLKYKDSPTDRGKNVLSTLLDNKIYL